MKAECTDQQTFQLTENEQALGKLIYPSLFSYNAEIVLPNAEKYEVKSRGFFGTSIVVTKNDTEIANLRMNLKGQVVITLNQGQEFLFKNTHLFYNTFILEDREMKKLIQYEPSMNWRKLNYNYTITHNLESQDSLFVLIGIYASNYYMGVMSGLI